MRLIITSYLLTLYTSYKFKQNWNYLQILIIFAVQLFPSNMWGISIWMRYYSSTMCNTGIEKYQMHSIMGLHERTYTILTPDGRQHHVGNNPEKMPALFFTKKWKSIIYLFYSTMRIFNFIVLKSTTLLSWQTISVFRGIHFWLPADCTAESTSVLFSFPDIHSSSYTFGVIFLPL